MIKIEFKEANPVYCREVVNGMYFLHCNGYIECFYNIRKKVFSKYLDTVKSITSYIPTQDPMLDRSEILKQLGISQQEDELFQEQYKNV